MKIIFIILLIISLSYTFAQENIQSTDNQSDAKKAIRKGDSYLKNNQYSEALKWYNEADKLSKKNALLSYKMGVCYYFTNQNPSAINAFGKALLLDTIVAPDIHFLLAQSLHCNYDFEQAMTYYKIEKNNALAHHEIEYIEEIEKYILECQSGIILSKDIDSNLFISNIGQSINSKQAEYGSFVSENDSVMFITTKRSANIGTQNSDDIYFSLKQNNKWSELKNAGKPVNSYDDDAVIGISDDAKTLYLYSGVNNGDIFYTKKKDDKWSVPESISDKINSSFTESSLCLSTMGDTMFFTSDRPGFVGGKDIFYIVKKNNEWQNPINIGNLINTVFNEESVFYNHNTLYFASEGHNSIGGYDIFKTSRTQNGEWTKPENLGIPINSPYDDVFFFCADNQCYITSDREGEEGNTDIFEIKTRKIEFVASDSINTVPDVLIGRRDTVTQNINIQQVVVSNILFELNEYENPHIYQNLDTLAYFLQAEPDAAIEIIGYTDVLGGAKCNLNLSLKRADFIKQYLVSKGVTESAVLILGGGEKKPISKYLDENDEYIAEALKYNRRVEFEVIQQGKKMKLVIVPILVPKEFRR